MTQEEYKKALTAKTTGLSLENAKKLVALINENVDIIFADSSDATPEEKQKIDEKFKEMSDKYIAILSESEVPLDYAVYAFDIVDGFINSFKNSTARLLNDTKEEILSLVIDHKEDVLDPNTNEVKSELRAEYAPIGKYYSVLSKLK